MANHMAPPPEDYMHHHCSIGCNPRWDCGCCVNHPFGHTRNCPSSPLYIWGAKVEELYQPKHLKETNVPST